MSVQEVLDGTSKWWVDQGDLLEWLPRLPEKCIDLFMFSPPYERADLRY